MLGREERLHGCPLVLRQARMPDIQQQHHSLPLPLLWRLVLVVHLVLEAVIEHNLCTGTQHKRDEKHDIYEKSGAGTQMHCCSSPWIALHVERYEQKRCNANCVRIPAARATAATRCPLASPLCRRWAAAGAGGSAAAGWSRRSGARCACPVRAPRRTRLQQDSRAEHSKALSQSAQYDSTINSHLTAHTQPRGSADSRAAAR